MTKWWGTGITKLSHPLADGDRESVCRTAASPIDPRSLVAPFARAAGHTHCVPRRGKLWTCPKCGRKFVGRNMWHACGDYSVEGFLEEKGDRAPELFDGFEQLIAACGPYEVAPAKTRVAFMARVRFAGVNAISDRR